MSIQQVYSSIPLLTSILGKLETNISSSGSKAVAATGGVVGGWDGKGNCPTGPTNARFFVFIYRDISFFISSFINK